MTVHDEDVHQEVALELSCESRDTNSFDGQIVDRPCGKMELVHSSSSIVGIQTFMTNEILPGSDENGV